VLSTGVPEQLDPRACLVGDRRKREGRAHIGGRDIVPTRMPDVGRTLDRMLTLQYAKALPHIQVNAVAPGYTRTDFTGNSGPQTVTEGTDAVLRVVSRGSDAGTAGFYYRHGRLAW
jgi:hypothetical protein